MNFITEYNNHTALYVKFCEFRALFFAIRINYSIIQQRNFGSSGKCVLLPFITIYVEKVMTSFLSEW
jgi:hypothetical protein